jgi:hypothetical protein
MIPLSILNAAPIAAAVARTYREIVGEFRKAGAVRPEKAMILPSRGGHLWQRCLDRLIEAGAVRQAGGGLYLDEEAYSAFLSQRRVRVLVILTIALLVMLVVWFFTSR